MEGKPFLIFVDSPATDKFATFRNGYLEWVGYPLALDFTPDGWQDFQILVSRNKDAFGFDRTYGTPQDYVNDGAGILKSIFAGAGIRGVARVTIVEQKILYDDVEYGYYYDLLCKCDIDFSTYDHTGEKVNVSMLDGELSRLIKANKDVQYEVDLSNRPNILFDGLRLKQYANFVVNTFGSDPLAVPNGNNLPGWTETSSEQKTQLGTKGVDRTYVANNAAIINSKEWVQETDVETPITFKFNFRLAVNVADASVITLGLYYMLSIRAFPKGSTDPNSVLVLGGDPNAMQVYTFNIGSLTTGIGTDARIWHDVNVTKTFTIPANYDVYVFSGLDENAAQSYYFYYDTTTSDGLASTPNLNIQYDYVPAPTTAPSISAFELGQELLAKMTANAVAPVGTYQYVSSLLSSTTLDPYTRYVSGDSLRGIPNPVLKTSWSDYFSSINSTFNVGYSIEGNSVVLEKKAYWCTTVSPSDVVNLGAGSKLNWKPATDMLFSAINVGCENETYDEALGDINGRYEFNMTLYFSTPITAVSNVLDLTTKYRRDMYGAEFTRLDYYQQNTTSSPSDNDCFELHTQNVTSGYAVTTSLGVGTVQVYRLDRTDNQYTTGLLDQASAFNIRLSPKHCLLRHADYIRSFCDLADDQYITFNSADKQVPMVTTYPSGVVVDQRKSELIGSFPAQIFKPYYIADSIPVPEYFLAGGIVKKYILNYNNGDVVVSGFPQITSIQLATRKQQDFQLLCSPDVDTSQMINIWD